jgi:hypothetical protein
MAKQLGVHKLKGRIDELTYYRSKDGYIAAHNNPPTAARIQSDPAFVRTRENMSEFARAVKAGKLLRTAIRTLLQNAKDGSAANRLTKKMVEVIKTDTTSARGQRTVTDGDAELLQGFEFNADAQLRDTIYAPYTATIDRVAGTATVSIPSFVPINMIVAPQGATHFKIVSMGAEIDFAAETFVTDVQESAMLPIDTAATTVMDLANALTANSSHPLFLLLSLQFYQQLNGVDYPLRDGTFNPLSIVKVDGAA